MIIYQPPTVWSLLRGAAINLILPFVNGLMLGFGELLAHEFAFRLGWSSTNVSCIGFLGLHVLMICAGVAPTPRQTRCRTRGRNER